jgi:hypothetical protein
MNRMMMMVMMMVVVGCNWKEEREGGRKEGRRKGKQTKGKEAEVFFGDDSSLAVTAPLLFYANLILSYIF